MELTENEKIDKIVEDDVTVKILQELKENVMEIENELLSNNL